MVDPRFPFGEGLRSLRKSYGLTLPQLAARLGWDKARLSKYEMGKRSMSLSVMEEIAAKLGQDPEVLILYLLKHRYPRLAEEDSELGNLVTELVQQVQEYEAESE
jgi:transcriptional regulator with XRE-family HTH domain